jgi:hypothetical protein
MDDGYSFLEDIVEKYKDELAAGRWQSVLLVEDTDGHLSTIYKIDGRVAQQYQDGINPVIYPRMTYRVMEMTSGRVAVAKMKERAGA